MAAGRFGQSNSQNQSVGLALGRLRLAVVLCCWMVGLGLGSQLVIWSLAAYTDTRFDVAEQGEAMTETAVVAAESPRQQRIRQAREAELGIDLGRGESRPVEPKRVLSRTDGIFATIYDAAAGIGRSAMLAIIPLMMVGVMLAAGSATPGVERVVSSLVWALLGAVLILPLGSAFGLPWESGALSSYQQMTNTVDQVRASTADAASTPGEEAPADDEAVTATGPSSLVMHGRFGLLPCACMVGMALVGLRFCAGVEAGILAAESMRLDPALEREAANMSPSSLHAGRTTGVLSRTLQRESEESMPSAKTVSPGESPQRLI